MRHLPAILGIFGLAPEMHPLHQLVQIVADPPGEIRSQPLDFRAQIGRRYPRKRRCIGGFAEPAGQGHFGGGRGLAPGCPLRLAGPTHLDDIPAGSDSTPEFSVLLHDRLPLPGSLGGGVHGGLAPPGQTVDVATTVATIGTPGTTEFPLRLGTPSVAGFLARETIFRTRGRPGGERRSTRER